MFSTCTSLARAASVRVHNDVCSFENVRFRDPLRTKVISGNYKNNLNEEGAAGSKCSVRGKGEGAAHEV